MLAHVWKGKMMDRVKKAQKMHSLKDNINIICMDFNFINKNDSLDNPLCCSLNKASVLFFCDFVLHEGC